MSEAQWVDVDISTLSQDEAKAYEAYKVAQRAAAKLREEFETTMAQGYDIPQGMRLAFGYRFGKLSVALVLDDRKPSKAKQPKLSLADYLARQQA